MPPRSHDTQLTESAWNSLIIAVVATVVSTVIGTLCAYGLWKRTSRPLAGSLYLSLVTPEIVTGISLLAFYQWIFRFLRVQLGMHTVILAHVSFSIAYVVIVVIARLRTVDATLEEAALDLGANEWQAFRYVTLPAILPGVVAAALLAFTVSFDDYVITSLVAGVDSETLAHGDLRHRAPRRQSCRQRDLGAHRHRIRFAGPDLGKAAHHMNRRHFLFGTLAATGLTACSSDRRPRLNIFNWSAYIAPDTVPKFEAEFGVRVRYGIYESNEEMLARVMGGNSGWDIVFPTDYIVKPLLANGLVAPIHREVLPNLSQLEPRFQRPDWDPNLNWSVPYMVTAAGIAYNRKLLNPPPKAWADMWDPRLKGRMTMLDDPFDTMGACLKKLGFSVNTADPAAARSRSRRGHQPEAAAARLSERRSPRPVGFGRCAGRAHVEHHRAASHGFVARRRLRLSGRRLRRVSGCLGDPAREQAPGAGAPVHQFPAAPRHRRRQRAHRAHHHDQCRRPQNLAARISATIRRSIPAPDIVARGEWAITLDPATQRLRDRLWTEIKAA